MTSSSRKAKLEIEIEIDIPIDIINDKQRFGLVEEGIIEVFPRVFMSKEYHLKSSNQT